GRGEGGTARVADGVQLHDLRARAVGIEQVELPLRIPADLGQARLILQPVAVPEERVRRFDVPDAEREVIEHPGLRLAHARRSAVTPWRSGQHVFEPVRAVRHLLRDPGRIVLPHAAEPIGPEAENRAVESMLAGPVVEEEADMDDVPREGIDGNRRRMRRRLHELDAIAFGILHLEPTAAIAALPYPRRN